MVMVRVRVKVKVRVKIVGYGQVQGQGQGLRARVLRLELGQGQGQGWGQGQGLGFRVSVSPIGTHPRFCPKLHQFPNAKHTLTIHNNVRPVSHPQTKKLYLLRPFHLFSRTPIRHLTQTSKKGTTFAKQWTAVPRTNEGQHARNQFYLLQTPNNHMISNIIRTMTKLTVTVEPLPTSTYATPNPRDRKKGRKLASKWCGRQASNSHHVCKKKASSSPSNIQP